MKITPITEHCDAFPVLKCPWMGLGATWASEGYPCPQLGVEKRWSLRLLATQTILWFCDSRNDQSPPKLQEMVVPQADRLLFPKFINGWCCTTFYKCHLLRSWRRDKCISHNWAHQPSLNHRGDNYVASGNQVAALLCPAWALYLPTASSCHLARLQMCFLWSLLFTCFQVFCKT